MKCFAAEPDPSDGVAANTAPASSLASTVPGWLGFNATFQATAFGIQANVPVNNAGWVWALDDISFGGAFTNYGLLQAEANADFSGGFTQSGPGYCSLAGGTYNFTRDSASLGGTFVLAGGTLNNFGGAGAGGAGPGTSQNTIFYLAGTIDGQFNASGSQLFLTGDLIANNWISLWGCYLYVQGNALTAEEMGCENLPAVNNAIYLQMGSVMVINSYANDGSVFGPGTLNGQAIS